PRPSSRAARYRHGDSDAIILLEVVAAHRTDQGLAVRYGAYACKARVGDGLSERLRRVAMCECRAIARIRAQETAIIERRVLVACVGTERCLDGLKLTVLNFMRQEHGRRVSRPGFDTEIRVPDHASSPARLDARLRQGDG